MDYLAWNDAIGARFFNPDRSGARVFLYVSEDVVTEVGAPHDADLDDFIAAVKTGPPWNTRQGLSICKQALQAFEDWRDRNLDYPPHICYLAFFVLADTVNVGRARHAYYPGLRHLLGEESVSGMYPSFDQMYMLWDDLAEWSNQDQHGDWGVFNADIVGGWMHVGLPRAQTLLTDRERSSLPFLFADNGLDPLSPPSDREFAYLLASDPDNHLRRHTVELLQSKSEGDSQIRAALVEILLEELEHWDGMVPPRPDSGEQTSSSLGNLRLAMMLDRTARIARLSLRCRSNREYPDEGLQLIGKEIEEPLYCYEDWQGWSTLLASSESQTRIFDPSNLDWLNGLTLIDREHKWKTSLSKRSIRVMVKATPFGFDGFVEENQIPQGKPFYLLAHNKHADTLQAWGNECCQGFTDLGLIPGLPNRWRLYSVDKAHSDSHIRDEFPFLAFPDVVRIQLRGGLKVKGNQYFTFALPEIEVTGVDEGVNVFCNDYQLDFNLETRTYSISNAQLALRLIVEVRRDLDGECIRKRSLYAVESVEWRDTMSITNLDKFGQPAEHLAAETCVGSIVNGVTTPEFNSGIFLPPSTGNRVYLVGKNPGEIVECPSETLSSDWRPVWAVQMQKRGKGVAVYCGTEPVNEAPGTNICRIQKRRKLWKEILWHKRKRIEGPSHPVLRSLWQQYREVAHHVR